MVSLPFLALLMGIMELAMLFMVSTNLDNATAAAGRTIRTGQLQTAGGASSGSFKTTICNNMSWLQSSCAANLYVDVRVLASFDQVAAPPIVSGVFVPPTTFTPGCPADIVEVRSFYKWTLLSPLLTQAVSDIGGGQKLLTSTLLFRNEPYSVTC